jgi:hypothetical protein
MMDEALLARVRELIEELILGEADPRRAIRNLVLIPAAFGGKSGWLLKVAQGLVVPDVRAEAFIEIAPHLPQSDLPELLDCVSALPDDKSLTAALVGVAPLLTDDLLAVPRGASMRISSPDLRKLAVLALDEQWPLLPDARAERLGELVAQVSEPLRSIISVPLRSALAPVAWDLRERRGRLFEQQKVLELLRLLSRLSQAECEEMLEHVVDSVLRDNQAEMRRPSATPEAFIDTLDDEAPAAAPESEPGELAGAHERLIPQPAPPPAAVPAPAAGPSPPAAAPAADPRPAASPAPAPQEGTPKLRSAPKGAPLPAGLPAPLPNRTRGLPRKPARARSEGNVVNTGFASADAPATGLSRHSTLVCGSSYYFWLDIGTPDRASIEKTRQPLPKLPIDAEVDVIVFDFARDEHGERAHLALRGKRRGVLRMAADGSGQVAEPAAVPDSRVLAADDPRRARRLFFEVEAPPSPGQYALRVGIYYQNNLLQSRLVRALVASEPREARDALSSELDYVITHALAPELMRKLQPQRLSVLLNDDGEGLVGFRFVGERDFQRDTTLSAAKLKTQIDMARQALHMASWGSPEAYTRGKGLQDRYGDGSLNLGRLTRDLIDLAAAGYRLWISLGHDLAGGKPERQKLAKLMLKSGHVQLALKRSASFVFPVALLYDRGIDAQTADSLCPAFEEALQRRKPLETAPCFEGDCPSMGKLKVVCPSGFWGFRHEIGVPLSVADGDQLVTDIPAAGGIGFDALAHHDLAFRAKHLDALRKLRPIVRWSYAEGRDPAIELLQSSEPHIVYFYCHGGYRERDKLPYLDLGGPVPLTPDYLTATEVCWNDRRPLVFLNGCHTTALTPEIAIDLVNAFLVEARAAGVLGTEVTVFETLAAPFAEHCLKEFVSGVPIGSAVRRARLAVLATGSPLGLAYIPFATSALRLTESSP